MMMLTLVLYFQRLLITSKPSACCVFLEQTQFMLTYDSPNDDLEALEPCMKPDLSLPLAIERALCVTLLR